MKNTDIVHLYQSYQCQIILHNSRAPVGHSILHLSLRDEDQTLLVEHNVTICTGTLDMDRLQYAFETIISRHDALRTSFTLDKQTGEVHAFIHDKCASRCDFFVTTRRHMLYKEYRIRLKLHCRAYHSVEWKVKEFGWHDPVTDCH